MEKKLCELLRINDDSVGYIIDELKQISISNEINWDDLVDELNNMDINGIDNFESNERTQNYMLLRVYLKIKEREMRSLEIEEMRDLFYRKSDQFTDDDHLMDDINVMNILTESEKKRIILTYQLKKIRKIEILENLDIYGTVRYILNYFTPIIFPIVEDLEWIELDRSTPLHKIPDNSRVYAQTLPMVYDTNKVDDWLDMMMLYLDDYLTEYNMRIIYKIREDCEYDINWIYIIMRE